MPIGRLVKSSVIAVKELGPVQAYVYGPVPPVAVKLTDPVEPPKHKTFVATADADNAIGCVIVAVAP